MQWCRCTKVESVRAPERTSLLYSLTRPCTTGAAIFGGTARVSFPGAVRQRVQRPPGAVSHRDACRSRFPPACPSASRSSPTSLSCQPALHVVCLLPMAAVMRAHVVWLNVSCGMSNVACGSGMSHVACGMCAEGNLPDWKTRSYISNLYVCLFVRVFARACDARVAVRVFMRRGRHAGVIEACIRAAWRWTCRHARMQSLNQLLW